MSTPARHPRLALVLGSGSARGWAHIGVIKALEEAGIKPDIVCGTSIGALVGAAYAAGELERFESWVRSLSLRDVVSLMDFRLNGGMLKGERLMNFFQKHFMDCPIEALRMPFVAVATDLHTGQEVWLKEGSVIEAVRASIALPGLFSPVRVNERLLVDGGLVNPVPVSLARAMEADFVVAVDLNADILGRHLEALPEPKLRSMVGSAWLTRLPQSVSALFPLANTVDAEPMPSLIDVLASSINIMQVRITRSRLAGDPPDVVIAPRLASLGLLDFHRADQAIEQGMLATRLMLPSLQELGTRRL
ncbi:MAG TPA: patatin-like phospholipase RssA [Burkholderiaceae bacterium]|nr:patatin-like phospholipase RssA [Burkholderiaceae bacterium]